MSVAAARASVEKTLDFAAAAEVLRDLGVTKRSGQPLDAETVRTWADTGKLPFFKGPHGVRLILRSTLVGYFEAEQRKAIQSQQASAATTKRPRRR